MGMHRQSELYDKALSEMSASGASMKDTAELLDVSLEAIRAAKNRRGLSFVHQTERDADVSELIDQLSDRESIDFLLALVEELRNALCVFDTELAERFGLTFLENRLLGVLMASRGKTVPKDSAYSALYYDRQPDRLPSSNTVAVILMNLRGKLPEEFGRIDTIQGFGWRFVEAGSE